MADDHVMIRLGLAALVADLPDIEIIGEARNGKEAVELHAALRPDVTVMDGILPDFHGVEATRRILEQDPDAKVIILSINESAEDIRRAMDAGAIGYVPKSRHQEVLLRAIREVAAGRRFLDPDLERLIADRTTTNLSQRELDVLRLIANGLLNKQIAVKLALSENTVKTHIARIMGKLGVHDRTSLAMKAVTLGLLR